MDILIEFEKRPLLFKNPVHIIRCFNPAALKSAFAEIECFLKKGFYAAGFFSYEAGYAFEERLLAKTPESYQFPVLLMGCYQAPLRSISPNKLSGNDFTISDIRHNISLAEYAEDIRRIREYISLGKVYQITYCLKLRFDFKGEAFSLYRRLLTEQPVPYPAYIEDDNFKIISLSPELFIKKTKSFLITKPMKGTWPRGNNIFSDLFSSLRLKYDKKNRAENIMIADLLRNDLNRIAKNIKAPKLFEVARYKTLCQMTSTVTGMVNPDIPLYDLFKGIFPSGSVTGAPKISAMQIIRGLENEERRIYTGAIGYITPDKDLFFNVPIRTLLLQGARAEMGIGGGIVWDSTSQGEWAEGVLKAKFLTDL